MRLYLLNLSEDLSTPILTIAVIAPQERLMP
jgi:hypothetical protein